ncbi:adenylate/guanylate cyclase domain-containing protein [Stappia sp. GBMRC 2046]|uniref:Adenylate/guanylate cyclase domain-containing protein n=1 Tax=Stappia sediminis TaxID=2692190 RepID=A0A7X3LVM1_9HYPH|nr:adenylate/guanylate cyclase domain-containing protein [Stappia sediminis]MXN65860.1 adenylate/guanylate cyclase domain-containing protein [Stappia sediminis]
MTRIERKLAAILAADVSGYSALVYQDEEAAFRSFNAHISALRPIIGAHSGRLFKMMGDGFLVEFGSVVDAVSCAVAMQRRIVERNADEPDVKRMVFRMGVHVGDVIVDNDDILGDGVNIAVRLESIAKPGGVAVSARVFDDVENKLDLAFMDAGRQTLKNIPRPVHVYEAVVETQVPAYVTPDRPDKPSVAVLPFENMSSDPDQEYFADGLSEDLITALAHVPWIFVIARNSSFSYKGLSADVRKIAAELGVRYLLEGRVRRAGSRVRVNAQLVDADTVNHIWADHYDGDLKDIFELQDTITHAVVSAIAPKITSAEIERASRKRPDSLTAYDHYLKARAALNNLQIGEAADFLDKAINASSDYAKAKAVRAWCFTLYGWRDALSIEDNRDLAIRLAEEALASPNADAESSAYAGYTIAFMQGSIERGIRLVQDATEQCPSFAWAWASLALLHLYYRSPEKAIELGKIALRLSPRDPQSFRAEMAIAGAYFNLDRFEDCLSYAEESLRKAPKIQYFIVLKIVCLVQLGRVEEARLTARRYMERHPGFTISRWSALTRSSPDAGKLAVLEDALRQAGFPA